MAAKMHKQSGDGDENCKHLEHLLLIAHYIRVHSNLGSISRSKNDTVHLKMQLRGKGQVKML